MAYANGRLPTSALAPIPGNGRLRKDAAAAYNAMARAAAANGVSLAIHERSVGRTYRDLAKQYLAKRIYGRNAATPGTSNHGWGLSVDLMNGYQRAWIDRNGARFGWAKRWSDASWEWWHLRWREGIWSPAPAGPPVISPGSRNTTYVKKLQRLLRARGFKKVVADGDYGATTLRAVKTFQRSRRLRPDGVVGPSTWRALTRR